MALQYFEVTGAFKAIESDSSDSGGDPDTENISAFVWFSPSVTQVHSAVDHIVYRLQKVRGRINASDGLLKNIDGTPLTLVANNAAIGVHGLTYLVEFTNVRFDEADRTMDAFRFLAPQDGTQVDLSTVERMLP
jgi:hypothetical protein